MSADWVIPSDILQTDSGPPEQQMADIERSVVSSDEKDYIGDVSSLIACIARNGKRKQFEEPIQNLSAVGCEA